MTIEKGKAEQRLMASEQVRQQLVGVLLESFQVQEGSADQTTIEDFLQLGAEARPDVYMKRFAQLGNMAA